MHVIDKSLARVLFRLGETIYLNPKESEPSFQFCSGIQKDLSGSFDESTETFKDHNCTNSRSLNYYIKDENSIK